MSPEAREQMARTASDLAATSGQSFSRAYATLMVAANIEADAERRGAEKALRDAARSVYNGAPDLETSRGRIHIQSLYNEGAAPWLESLADEIAREVAS